MQKSLFALHSISLFKTNNWDIKSIEFVIFLSCWYRQKANGKQTSHPAGIGVTFPVHPVLFNYLSNQQLVRVCECFYDTNSTIDLSSQTIKVCIHHTK